MDLKYKKALITGGTRGLGKVVADIYTSKGIDVITCSRNATGSLNHYQCDVSDGWTVSRMIKDHQDLDVVVCNAGIYGPIGPLETIKPDEWKQAIEVNLYGVLNICRFVVPLMKTKRKGKIIILSGGGATQPMPNFSAYAASKAAVVRFGETLAEELREYNVDVNCVAPGSLNTDFMREAIAAGPELAGQAFYDRMIQQQQDGGADINRAADLCYFLASEESDGVTGKLIAAQWDAWKQMTKYNTTGDLYTLRRVNRT